MDRTALGSMRHFAYLEWFVVKLRPSVFIIYHSAFIISPEEGVIVNIAPDGGNKSQNVTECNGECNGSKMRKCLGFNMCNGVTGFFAVFSGIESTIDSLARFRLRRQVPKEGEVRR